MSVDDKQITSKIDNVLQIAKDTTIDPFGMIEVKGVIKTPNPYKCVNVVLDNLPEFQHCKDITVAPHIQVLKTGSNKIPVVLRNLSCRTLKLKKGTKIFRVKASSVAPTMVSHRMSENMLEKEAGNSPKSTLLETVPKAKEERIEKSLEICICKV